jgi:hypothetical protein
VKTSREFSIAGRILSSTGLPIGFGHRISAKEAGLRRVAASVEDEGSFRLARISTGSADKAFTNARLLVFIESLRGKI